MSGVDREALREALRDIFLRDVLQRHHPIMRSETGPFSGCRCGAVRLGEDVIQHVIDQLAPLLGDVGLRQRVTEVAGYCQQSARELGWAAGAHYLDATIRLRHALNPPANVPAPGSSGHAQRVPDRVTADDVTGIDEIVLHDVDVHIEAMSAKAFTLIFTRPDGLRLHAEMWSPRKPLTLQLFEVEGGHGVHIDDGLLDPPTPNTGAAT